MKITCAPAYRLASNLRQLPDLKVPRVPDKCDPGRGLKLNHGSDEFEVSDSELIDKASSLLSQQIWCWGQDILFGSGNLLVQFGFQRIEKPADSEATSIYRLELTPSTRVILRGFGDFIGDDRWGGLFLHRFSFAPKMNAEADLIRPPWLIRDLPPLNDPRSDQIFPCQRLLLALTDWIGDYEIWIEKQFGISYRRNTLIEWNPKNTERVPGEEMAATWRAVGLALTDGTNHTLF